MRQWLHQATRLTYEPRLQLQTLVEACERGVERCHWLDSNIDGTILGEILTSAGTGIMLSNSTYERVRFAMLPDVHHIKQILEKPISELVLVHKSSAYLEQHIENFLVFFGIDEALAGCCELIFYKENKSLELASLAVKQEYRNRGIGKQLIAAAQEQAGPWQANPDVCPHHKKFPYIYCKRFQRNEPRSTTTTETEELRF